LIESELNFSLQNLRQALREGGARQHSVEAGIDCVPLQFDLHVREEADDRRSARLLIRLEKARGGKWIVTLQVQVDDDEVVRAVSRRLAESVKASRKDCIDAEMFRRRANLRGEKKIVDSYQHTSLHLQ
jgi:hypothetical protein